MCNAYEDDTQCKEYVNSMRRSMIHKCTDQCKLQHDKTTTIASCSQRVSLIVIPFCLSVWMSVGHSATYSLPRLIDHNQIWSAGIYLSSESCKPFWIPYLPYFWCQREKYATRILATVNVTHRAIWLVYMYIIPHSLFITVMQYVSIQHLKRSFVVIK